MSKELYRALFVTLIMVLSSLAGCIADSDDDTEEIVVGDEYYGTIMTSTYHV